MHTTLGAHGGRPALMIDGEPHPGIFSSARPAYARNVLDAGFDVVDAHPYVHHGWVGPGAYDYTLTDSKIESYLAQSTDCKPIVRFWMGYNQELGRDHPFWWSKLHPREVIRTSGYLLGPGDEVVVTIWGRVER